VAEPDSDAVLMRRTARGDAQAFRVLVERHHGAVFGLARRQLGSDPDAEEVVQDAFQRLFQAAGRYRPEVPLRGYLMTIAARLCLNRRARKERRYMELRAPQELDAVAADGPGFTPQRALERQELEARVRRALDALPADQRLAIVMMRFEGMDCAEIAKVMKRSVGAVHALLFRARNALRRSLVVAPGAGVEEVDHEPDL